MSPRSYPSGFAGHLGYDSAMRAPIAELSSLTTALDEVATRVTGIAEQLAGTEHDLIASELIEVERALGAAQRRLARLVERAG